MINNNLTINKITDALNVAKDNKVDKKETTFGDILDNAIKEGKTIAGYGASVGVTTLLYYYGVASYLDVLFDDNPSKQGLYSPGFHIPVVSSDDIYVRKPDYILCFPWRYKDPIIKRHQRYRDEGGRFIVPLPQVEIF